MRWQDALEAIVNFRGIVHENWIDSVYPQGMGINVSIRIFPVICTGDDEIAGMLHGRKKLSSMLLSKRPKPWRGADA